MDGIDALTALRRVTEARYQQAIMLTKECVDGDDWSTEQYRRLVAIVQTFDVTLKDIDTLMRDPRMHKPFTVDDYRNMIVAIPENA